MKLSTVQLVRIERIIARKNCSHSFCNIRHGQIAEFCKLFTGVTHNAEFCSYNCRIVSTELSKGKTTIASGTPPDTVRLLLKYFEIICRGTPMHYGFKGYSPLRPLLPQAPEIYAVPVLRRKPFRAVASRTNFFFCVRASRQSDLIANYLQYGRFCGRL